VEGEKEAKKIMCRKEGRKEERTRQLITGKLMGLSEPNP
jgi:hypothetical protein